MTVVVKVQDPVAKEILTRSDKLNDGVKTKKGRPMTNPYHGFIEDTPPQEQLIRQGTLIVYHASELEERNKDNWKNSKEIIKKLYPRW